MKLAADMLESEIEHSGKQAVLALEQESINRDLLGIVNMLKDLLLSICRGKHA